MERVVYKFMPVWGGSSLAKAYSHKEVVETGHRLNKIGANFVIVEDTEYV